MKHVNTAGPGVAGMPPAATHPCSADEAHRIASTAGRPPWDDRLWQHGATEQGWVLAVWGA